MEKIVKVNVDIKIARSMLGLAGFFTFAQSGTDEEIFMQVLDMMTCYGAKTEVVEDYVSPDAANLLTTMAILTADVEPQVADGSAISMFSEFDEGVCNNEVAF